MIHVVRDCSGFATLQWLIERSWSWRHLVCKTMQILDVAGGYMLPWVHMHEAPIASLTAR